MLLHTESLTLAYDKTVIISELNLTLPTEKITVFVGPNGCGKSTLLRGLARLLKPHTGAVYLNGQDIHAMPTKKLAQELGILTQNPAAPDGLTVAELVAHGRYPHQSFWRSWSTHDEAVVHQALSQTNLVDYANRPLETLSGGQRQRAWLAMALAQEPQILLLDEPTTFLDLAYQMELLDLLHDLYEQGRTIVMVLHDLNQACRYAHHIIAMRSGQIIAQGTSENVINPETIEAVFGLKAHIMVDPITGTPLIVPLGRRATGLI